MKQQDSMTEHVKQWPSDRHFVNDGLPLTHVLYVNTDSCGVGDVSQTTLSHINSTRCT